eukprot:gene18073-18312_t
MARGWNRDPTASISGGVGTAVSAALWSHAEDDVQEVWGDSDPQHHIVCVMHGGAYSAELWKDNRRVFGKAAPRDGVCLIDPGVVPRAVHRGPWSIMHLYIPDSLITRLVEHEGLARSRGALEFIDPQLVPDVEVARISHQVLAEIRAGDALSSLRIDALSLDLAIHLTRQHSNLTAKRRGLCTNKVGGLAPWQLKRTVDLLESDLSADVCLQALAGQSGLSSFHFLRAFKQSTGLPPHRFHIQLRLDRARTLLETTSLSVTEIAAEVGYDDAGYLARLFRKQFGTTPLRYRRRLENCVEIDQQPARIAGRATRGDIGVRPKQIEGGVRDAIAPVKQVQGVD